MPVVVTTEIGLKVIECSYCSMPFATSESWERQRRRDHKTFYCPNGHAQYFAGKSDVEKAQEKARDERERAARLQAELDQTEASLAATKGVVTKQRKKLERVEHGVCPSCKRHFTNLERHMKSKHG
jgi:hypothetical protein